jgi:DNA-binding transcriptional ArsR family regulator
MRDAISEVFAALSDQTRRDLYEQLLQSPTGATATELAEEASVSRQAIVKHLQVLTNSGLATARREGREVRYVIASDGTSGATAWLLEHASAWDRRLAALDRQIRSTSRVNRRASQSVDRPLPPSAQRS